MFNTKTLLLLFGLIMLFTGNAEQASESKKIASLINAGDSLYFLSDYNQAVFQYKEALRLVNDQELNRHSSLYNDIGLCYKVMGVFDSAFYYYSKAIQIDSIKQDSLKLAGRLNNMGNLLNSQGDFSEALSYYLRALTIVKDLNVSKAIADLKNSIGLIYHNQGRNNKSLEYIKSAYELFKLNNQQKKIAYALNNLGIIYEDENKLDSALYFFLKSHIIKKSADTISLPTTLHNLGKVYLKLSKFDSAHYYLTEAFNKRKTTGDQRGLAFTSNELANYYLTVNNPIEVKKHLDRALAYATEQDNQIIFQRNLELRSKYYEQIGDLSKAFDFLSKWSALRDSTFNQEKIKTLELQSTFDLEQSENQVRISEQQAVISRQQAQQNLILAIIFGTFLFTTVGFSVLLFRQRRKLRLLNEDLIRQKKKVETLNKQNFHFTKNSLAEVVSMLNIQTNRLEDGEVKRTLIAERLRMETINLLYKQLFSSGNGSNVDLKVFLEDTIENSFRSMLSEEVKVTRLLDLSSIVVPNEQALNLGIMTNEICINACKYAFTNANGEFRVALKEEERSYELTFSDTGNGLPGDIDWSTTKSFGLRLIRLLADGLQAELSIDNSREGLSYYFRIPKQPMMN